MAFELPPLPYDKTALEPHMSATRFDYHHGKHHQAYVTNLNNLVDGTDMAGKDLVEIIKATAGDSGKAGVFNNAAQVWNHTFFWNSMKPGGGGQPSGRIGDMISSSFGGFDAFKDAFVKEASTHFGSGWAWLVQDDSGKLKVISTHDADTPVVHGLKPILTCDVWEHAYYIDYRNARPDYIAAYWNLVNWDFANQNLG